MPICHVVTFTFKDETSSEWIGDLGAALDQLGTQTRSMSYHHGRDEKLRVGNADYSVTAIFEDEAAFIAYINSPAHLQVVNELLTPHLLSRSAVQFSIDSPERPSERVI